MIVTVKAPLVHMCPYRVEVDNGRVEMEFVGEAPELHDLSLYLRSFSGHEISHEALTKRISEDYPDANVRTFWHTAGCEVEVIA